jgi:D-serine deaminase-like pyridoxal phosphate-dependent protein
VENASEIASPALLVYPDRVEANIRIMIGMAGDKNRLWPHVKTHKTSEILLLQMKHGIQKFKCATIAEGEMVASCGAEHVLLAIQPTGPNIDRFFLLKQKFPETQISTIADSEAIIRALSVKGRETGIATSIWLDINCGMNRTGIVPGDEAIRLFTLIGNLPYLKAGGIHPYDGHIHESSLVERRNLNKESFSPIMAMIAKIKSLGLEIPSIIAGGTPTMGILSKMENVELSPGTSVLWDQGYGEAYAEMEFIPAAVLLSRVVSKPNKNLLTLDIGTKAIASEMPHPRIQLLGIDTYTVKEQWEEYFVIETSDSDRFNLGDTIYGIPYHICPTVARYESWHVIENSRYKEQWKIIARDRKISI